MRIGMMANLTHTHTFLKRRVERPFKFGGKSRNFIVKEDMINKRGKEIRVIKVLDIDYDDL
jgi:hypothetical protein